MAVEVVVTTTIRAAAAVVLDLELDVDVHADSVAGNNETATTSTGRRQLSLGDEVTFRARHFGVTWTMTSRITELEHPHRFVDEQVRGPFTSMRHEHLFVEDPATGTTTMTDRMQVALPWGPLGVAAGTVVGPYLRRLLIRRGAHVKQLAERRPH